MDGTVTSAVWPRQGVLWQYECCLKDSSCTPEVLLVYFIMLVILLFVMFFNDKTCNYNFQVLVVSLCCTVGIFSHVVLTRLKHCMYYPFKKKKSKPQL